MGLVRVYKARGPADAWLAKHQLEAVGIPVVLRGEPLMGLVGEIPVGEAWPSLFVPPEFEGKALSVLEDLREGPTSEQPEWTCPACRERVDAGFEVCWSCGTPCPEP